MNYFYAILYLKPKALFRILDVEDYKTLEWDRANLEDVQKGGNGVGEPPTEAECKAVEVEATAMQTAIEKDRVARGVLSDVDVRAIRGLREFVVAKFGTDALMPQQLKDHEAAAIEARKDLKP